ncbi:MAG TPA: YceI family protein [Candidatus Dormibacteraeota bacterium]|nr:YceI family protein [Candidatus Dormibacteraeota bacterium]
MRRNLIVGAATGVAVIALIGASAYAYFFSGLRTSPSSLALSATPTATSSPAGASTGLAGTWKVTTGSLAGYRVQELFAGATSKHLAVARTSNVSGNLTVSGASAGYQVSGITLSADLSSLHSVDQVVGRNVTQRDGIVSRQLSVQQFPNATFTAASTSIPGPIAGSPVDVTAAGKLTIRGVTRDVTATAKAQVLGDRIEIAGTMTINMTDYGVTPPQVPFTAVDSTVTIEFDVFLTKT